MGRINVEQTEFEEVLAITPQVFSDNRGFFQESYNQKDFLEAELMHRFVQDNHSFSKVRGTIRGVHYQTLPMAQTKLVRVVQGAIWDVVVDLRKDSKHYGRWISVELSDNNHKQILIPKGFGHAFQTLSDDCHVVYKVDEYYSSECNAGFMWNDSEINIDWPISDVTLSDQDGSWPSFAQAMEAVKFSMQDSN